MTDEIVQASIRNERDGYKRAYEVTAEELGAARVLIGRYRQMFEASAADRLAEPAPPIDFYLNPEVRSFLMLGNGRTGSTWLLTSADRLFDIVAQREINWRPPGVSPQRIHAYIDGSSQSIRQAIAVANTVPGTPRKKHGSAWNVGAKLVFDPYGFNGPETFEHLEKIIEPEVKLIALRRSYLEWWLSWKARGVYHEVHVDVLQKINRYWERELASLTAMHKPEVREIVLTNGGTPMADTTTMNNPIHYPLRDAIDDMLMAFSNDVESAKIVRMRGGMILDYSEIAERFSEFAHFVGTTASQEEIDSIGLEPLTKKLDTLPPELVKPTDVLVELNGILVRALNADTSVWRWRDRGVAEIHLPDLAEFLRKHGIDATGATSGLAPSENPDVVVWQVRKPVYTL